LLLTSKKKNYANITILKEGKIIDNELDLKGLSMKKSNVNKNTGRTLQEILEEKILKEPEINIPSVLKDLEKLENEIRNTFISGKTDYMTPTSAKNLESYKDFPTIAAVRAALAWNAAYPNKPLVLPENFNMCKCKITSLEDIEDLKEVQPEIYKRLKNDIFDDERLSKYGITYFAIPKTEPQIPEWLVPYIDIETIINDNIKVFNPILESLGLKILSNTEGDFYSNVLTL
jgi:hypothetical protein